MDKIVAAFWQMYDALQEQHLLGTITSKPVTKSGFRPCKGGIVFPNGEVVELLTMDISIYILFIRHPEGIGTHDLWRHYSELLDIYRHRSSSSDLDWIERRIDDLCDPPYDTFYTHISIIRRRITAAMSPVDAHRYCIARSSDGRYRIAALRK